METQWLVTWGSLEKKKILHILKKKKIEIYYYFIILDKVNKSESQGFVQNRELNTCALI